MAYSQIPPQLILLSRTGCHLCTEAEKVLSRLATELTLSWKSVDVDSDPELQAEYGDRVPVLLLNGEEHGFWRIDEERLRSDVHKLRQV